MARNELAWLFSPLPLPYFIDTVEVGDFEPIFRFEHASFRTCFRILKNTILENNGDMPRDEYQYGIVWDILLLMAGAGTHGSARIVPGQIIVEEVISISYHAAD